MIAFIEFILKNWYVVIVLMAIVSAMLKKRNDANGEGRRGPSGGGMPTFGGGPHRPGRVPERRTAAPMPSTMRRAADGRRPADHPAAAGRRYAPPNPEPGAPPPEPASRGTPENPADGDRPAQPLVAADDAPLPPETDTSDAPQSFPGIAPPAGLDQPLPARRTLPNFAGRAENPLIEAIIWAEVLGPPRAKNRHRPHR